MSAIAPMTSLVKFNFSVSSHQCLLPLQLSFIFCECLGWQNSTVKTFNVKLIQKAKHWTKFCLLLHPNLIHKKRLRIYFLTTKYFQVIYFICSSLYHDSQYLDSSYCRYQSLSHSLPQQNFWQLFFSFWKVWGYPTLLISWFINFKTGCLISEVYSKPCQTSKSRWLFSQNTAS